jgi:hypothetical protein
MLATISTQLDTSADRAWHEVKRTSTFLHVTRGVLGLSAPGLRRFAGVTLDPVLKDR